MNLNESLLREAEHAAEMSGLTLSGYLDEALRERIGRKPLRAELPIFDSGIRLQPGFDWKAWDSEP